MFLFIIASETLAVIYEYLDALDKVLLREKFFHA